MKKIYTLLMIACCFGFVQNSKAQCQAGEVEAFIDVITDAYGYEVYWELVPSGSACGTGTIFAGGNTAVGCGGGGVGSQPAGGYANSSIISEGGFCLVIGQDYDIIAVDDWGDGGTCFEVLGGSTYCMSGTSANDVFTFTAQPPADHNLTVKSLYYDTLMIPNPTADSMSTLYYTQIPRRQAQMELIVLGATVKNSGGTTQTGIELTATVNDGSNDVFVGAKSSNGILSGATDTMLVSPGFTPVANGTYDVTLAVTADSTDAVPSDNSKSSSFIVGDTVYARDDENFGGASILWYGAGVNFEIGNMYELFSPDTITSVSYYNFTSGSTGAVGNVISLNVYDGAGFGTFTPICSTGFYTITASDTDTWITVSIDGGAFPVGSGQYVVTLETFSDQAFLTSQEASPYTSYVDPDNSGAAWYYTSSLPWVRLNVQAPSQSCALTATGVATDLNCPGTNDGTAGVTATGGTAPYTYLWDDTNATTSDSLLAVGGGMYHVVISDAVGCMYQMALEINEPAPTGVTLNASDVTCNAGADGSINVVLSGGTAPFTYTWSDTTLSGGNVTGLGQGSYSVTVDDANGCPGANASATIVEPAAMVLAFSQVTASCGTGGSATVAVTGGVSPYMYLWDDSNAQTTASASNLASDQYTCTVTDTNGCVAMVTDSVQGTPPVTVSMSKTDPSVCGLSDGDATVTIVTGTGPFAYNWSDAQTASTATGLAAGVYNVTITDFILCTTTASITLLDPGAPTLQTVVGDVSCLSGTDGTATVTAFGTGPFTYSWNSSPVQSNAAAAGLPAGVYAVSVVDGGGCTSFASDTVGEPATAFTIDAVTGTDVSCSGDADGSLTASASGGTGAPSYVWNGGPSTPTYSGLTGGTYTVVAMDVNLCVDSATGTVSEPTALAASASNTDITCNGDGNGAVTTTVTGGSGAGTYSYVWTPGGAITPDLTGLDGGSYSVVVSDSNGCTALASATITEPTALTASISTFSDETILGLNDGAITAAAGGGTGAYSPFWSGPGGFTSTSLVLTNLEPGTYQLTLNDGNGCQATATQIILPGVVGIVEVINNVEFKVYPNPNTGQFIVELNRLKNEEYQIEIRNIIGQLILTENVSEVNGNFYKSIDLSAKETGVYFISLINEEGKTTEKLVVY